MTLTPALTVAIVENIGLGMPRPAAAAAAGVSATMLASWEKRAATTKGKAHKLIAAIVAAEARMMREAYADRSDLSPVEFAQQNVRDVTMLRARAVSAGSSQAAAMLNRQLVKAYDALAAARKAGDVGLEEMTEEEYRAELRRDVGEWPEDYFGIVFDSYKERHRVLVVFSPMGGKAASS